MTKKNNGGILIAVGGGESANITEHSVEIAERFLELAGGAGKGEIVVMTVATDNPEAACDRYSELFGKAKHKSFEVVDVSLREEAFDESMLEKVRKATGLYFTGGNQLHVMALMGGTPLHELILEKFSQGLVIAGTSAGAMMMSSSTLVSGAADTAPRYDSVDVTAGMNLLPDSIIDTHFSQRGRHGRLISAVSHNPQVLGFGIDERTAMIVHTRDAKFEVCGEGAVTVINVGKSKHSNLAYLKDDASIGIFGVCIDILPHGYKYDLQKREPIAPSLRQMKKGS